MNLRDYAIIRRLKAGDPTAFEAVVGEHYPSVYRQLWHLCGSAETAADLTQETFLQAWKSLSSFQGRSALRTWLYTIAVRVWRRSQSDAELMAPLPLDELAETLPDPGPGPDQLLECSERQKAVREGLHRLPAVYRETLVLYYVQGLKYREIAVVLGVPLGTVKSRLHGALSQLRDDLARDREEEVL